MKYLKILLLAVVAILFVANPVYAQDTGGDIPGQLKSLVEQLGALGTTFVVLFMGYVSNRVTAWIRSWGVFTEKDRSKIAGITADILSGVSSLLTTLVLLGVNYAVGLIPEGAGGLIPILTLITWTTSSLGVHKYNKIVKGIRALAS